MTCTVRKLWHSLYQRHATLLWFTVLFSETWESSYLPTVLNSSFGAIFAKTAGFNMTKALKIYVLISFHVLMEQNALNLVMLSDMQLRHCYCFVVENMKLCIVNI